jgi:hypothetical protein
MKKLVLLLLLIVTLGACAQVKISDMTNTTNSTGLYVPGVRAGSNFKFILDSLKTTKLDSIAVRNDSLFEYRYGNGLGVFKGKASSYSAGYGILLNSHTFSIDTFSLATRGRLYKALDSLRRITAVDTVAINNLISINSILSQTITAIRALTEVVGNGLVYLKDPNIGGLFYYDSADHTSADDGLNVIVDAAGNRYKRSTEAGAFPSIAAMRASTYYLKKLPFYSLSGYYANGDGGSGYFYYDAASSATDDGVTVIKPTEVSGAGRYIRIDISQITAAQAGIKNDGTDQTSRMNAVFALSVIKSLTFSIRCSKDHRQGKRTRQESHFH